MRWSSRGSPASRPIQNNPRFSRSSFADSVAAVPNTEADLVDDSVGRLVQFRSS